MPDLLAELYLRITGNFLFLIENPQRLGILNVLMIFLLLVTSLTFLKYLLSWISIRFLKHQLNSLQVDGFEEVHLAFKRAALNTGLSRIPALYPFYGHRPLIFTNGIWFHSIFISPLVFEKVTSKELEAIFTHEMVHIKRKDNLLISFLDVFTILSVTLTALFFILDTIVYHNVLYFHFFKHELLVSVLSIVSGLGIIYLVKTVVWRRLIYLRELSCDDRAIKSIHDPLVMASALAKIWKLETELPKHHWKLKFAIVQAFIPPAPGIKNRITRLLDYRISKLRHFLARTTSTFILIFIVLFSLSLFSFKNEYSDFHWVRNREYGLHICYNKCICHELKWPEFKNNLKPNITGQLIRITDFPSRFAEPRNIDIWIPPSYNLETTKKFPVLYMHNGQNLFDPGTSYIGVDWGVDETLTKWDSLHPGNTFIVVGLSHTYNSILDYMPEKPMRSEAAKSSLEKFKDEFGNPQSDAYLQFIVSELKPYIDSHFRTQSEQKGTFIAGAGLGGLISLYALCEYPDVFCGAGSFSALWSTVDPEILNYLESHLPEPSNHLVYLDTGTKTLDADQIEFHDKVTELLNRKGYQRGLNFSSKIFKGDEHSEVYWKNRFPFFANLSGKYQTTKSVY
ncbi:MAG: M48 family metalloprotease [Bacteroidetes bacterium]|nr:M48 family metalloprotease [Bacteroidota bacterium]